MSDDSPNGGALPEVFGKPAIREAIALLREYGVTPEQYAGVELVEVWTVDDPSTRTPPGDPYPSRAAAFVAAQEMADRCGKWADVWLHYGPIEYGAESWIVKPRDGEEQP